MYIMDTIFNDLKNIIDSIVIKYNKTAKSLDTLEITKEADKHISAVLVQDSFNTYQKFDFESFVNAGVLDDTQIQDYVNNKYNIPSSIRDIVLKEQRKIIVRDYIEKNNYYRMLDGIPDLEDKDYIYIDEITAQKYSVSSSTPIHEMSDDDIYRLDEAGIINLLITNNTEKKYLNHLGYKSIDIVTSRTAKNFSILYMTKDMSESFYEEFNKIYEQSREYFMSVIYIMEYSKQYDLYDNFIALMIMIMSIQRIITNTFKYGIERDFYDLGSIKMMFDSYNVPFINDLPIEYQRILLRNLNTLLRYKSTDKVLYDICTLLGFERIKIFKYFLIKEHKLDTNENPIFVYKEETDGQGNKYLVEDKEQMYAFYFKTVELRERNVALALNDTMTKQSIDQVTAEDPYWETDDDLMNTLYDNEFNYVETKYLNMNIMYKMTSMLFEVMYLFRMLLDKKDDLVNYNIEIQIPKLIDNRPFPLFDIVVLLCALLSKKNSLAGNILVTPSKILSVMGFNFKTDLKSIVTEIQSHPELYDKDILQYFNKPTIQKPEDINNIYLNIRNLNDFLIDKLSNCQDIKQYHAYKNLYNTLMIMDETTDLFMKSDDTTALTYLDYLQDKNVELYDFVLSCDIDKIPDYIDNILYKLNELATDLQYVYLFNDSNNVLLNAIITLTQFFKSYTTNLASFNILYLMDSKYYNMIKIIHDIHYIESSISPRESFKFTSKDVMKKLSARITSLRQEYMHHDESYFVKSYIKNKEYQLSKDKIKYITSYMLNKQHQNIIEKLKSAIISMHYETNISYVEKYYLQASIKNKDYQLRKDKINSLSTSILNEQYQNLTEKELIHSNFLLPKDFKYLTDIMYLFNSILYPKEYLSYENIINYMDKYVEYVEKINLQYSDILSFLPTITTKDYCSITDKIQIIYEE